MGLRPNTATRSSSRTVRDVEYRTVCKICGGGVYRDQASVWLTDPMGLSHAECARRKTAA